MKSSKLFLHTCCAPCLIPAFETLKENNIELIWYNPNIAPEKEYKKRLNEVQRYAKMIGAKLVIIGNDYNTEHGNWLKYISGLEFEPEGMGRCSKCFEFRLRKVASLVKDECIATTLVVSPFKDQEGIDDIGKNLSNLYQSYSLNKNDAAKLSVAECKRLNIYRQKYCGCEFSQKK